LTPEEAAAEALRAKSRAVSGLKRIDAALRKLLDRHQPHGGKGAHKGADKGVIPLYYQINIWGLRKGLAFEPRADEYTLAHSVRPAP
jgi:hypothetical protein